MDATQVLESTGTPAGRLRHWRIRTVVGRLLLMFTSLILTLTLLEGVLRFAGWPAPGLQVNGQGPIALRQPGRNGGAFPPSSAGRLRHYDYDVAWVVNEDGFRERSIYPKRAGEWRIGVLGDSFAAGYGVNLQERFADVCYRQLQSHHPNISFWNLSSPLCGTKCQAEMLEGVGRDYDLDELILVFYGGNDLQDNLDSYRNPAKQDPYGDLSVSERAKIWLREHSRLATFVWINGIRAVASFRPPGLYSRTELDQYWPYTASALAQLKSSTGPKRLSILYLPALPEWDDTTWKQIRDQLKVQDDGRFLVKQALRTWAQQQNIRFVDSTSWLKHCMSSQDCTFKTDGHLNSKGHLIIGTELAKAWSAENPLDK